MYVRMYVCPKSYNRRALSIKQIRIKGVIAKTVQRWNCKKSELDLRPDICTAWVQQLYNRLPSTRRHIADTVDIVNTALRPQHTPIFNLFSPERLSRNTWRKKVQSHAGTAVPECFKNDNANQWKSGNFDPRSLKNPEPIVT